MSIGWPVLYLIVFACALVLGLLLTPISARLGWALGILDRPGERKIHQKVIPRSGGLALYLTVMIVVGGGFFVSRFLAAQAPGLFPDRILVLLNNLHLVQARLGAMLLGATWIFALGLLDDRRGLGPWTKLAGQIIAALPLLLAGSRIVVFVPSPIVGGALTIAWIVLLCNSFNFMDNMDGLCAGVAAIVCAVLAFISWRAQEFFMTALILALAGALLGYLHHNFFPARVFFGDGGSLLVGYLLAFFTIEATYYKSSTPTGFPVLMPLIILGVPLFDTLTVMAIRLRRGKPLMQGDTNHFSHRLVALGLTQKQAVLFIYVITLAVALCALPLRVLPLPDALVQGLTVALLFVIIGVLEWAGMKRGNGT